MSRAFQALGQVELGAFHDLYIHQLLPSVETATTVLAGALLMRSDQATPRRGARKSSLMQEMAQAFLHTGPLGGHDRIAYGVPSCVISGDSMGSENSFK